MGNRKDTKIVLSRLRYKSSPETELYVNIPLVQNSKVVNEFDRTVDINLQQVYDDERQKSTIFRPSCKFSVIFKNSYTGSTNYTPLENNLYYVDAENSASQECDPAVTTVKWKGFMQYNEFDFIRSDYNVVGYTQPPNNHVTFVSKSASTYNWNVFLSYPFSGDTTKKMECYFSGYGLSSPVPYSWVASDGPPFIIDNTTRNGLNVISFRSTVKHNLSVGEYVKLSKTVGGISNPIEYGGIDTFQVNSLGDDFYGSEEYIFNIVDVGYTGGTFNDGLTGNFRRVINIDISGETISEYYVRKHKILNDINDTTLTKTGFELNGFGVNKKFESSGLTPTKISRVSVKEGSQSYTTSFNNDFDLNGVLDNQMRPVSELFFTVIWKGYFGYTFGLLKNSTEYGGLKQGFEFNLPLVGNNPSSWWARNNVLSDTNFPVGVYNTSMGSNGGPGNGPIPFTYVETLKKGDVIDGDYCEWNNYEQSERVISKINHKFTFNPFVFDISILVTNTNQKGYYYQPHHSLKIRDYSDYIEEGDKKNVAGIPDYSYFSVDSNSFIWRDLYPYGYIDPQGNGVNYPFFNGTHYPYDNFIFRIIPEGTNYIEQNITQEPLIDGCE